MINRLDGQPVRVGRWWAGQAMTALAAFLTAVPGRSQPANAPALPDSTTQSGDEIIVCGERFHTGAPVVLWTDKGGYDFHYSRAPGSPDERKPSRVRMSPLTDAQLAQVRRDGWTLDLLRDDVDQFVIHYSVEGTSRQTFSKLAERHLSVQLMLDLDGTIYQTMDLQEEAPHATKANGRSVGIEIANLGAYVGNITPLNEWYKKDASGQILIKIPAEFGDGGIHTKNFIGRPAREEIITGVVQGKMLEQYDFTPQQYNSLIHLTAALCSVFPKITCDYPRQKSAFGPSAARLVKDSPASHTNALAALNEPGVLIRHALSGEQYQVYQGILGHFHVQIDKEDPGPAFQWDTVTTGARKLMTPQALAANAAACGKPARFTPSRPVRKNGK
jgi:N-acetyl-anhydromuramyl-L-alanine amidase AmpD